jgi:hypothetical protein
VSFRKIVDPSSQATQLRIVVYDRGSGRMGSLTAPALY